MNRNFSLIAAVSSTTLLIAGICVAKTPAASAQIARTNVAASCSIIPNPYKVSFPVLESCGYTTTSLVSSSATSDGGTSYNYTIQGGSETIWVPPSSFKPVAASEYELAMYGIPSRPSTNSSDYGAWVAMYGQEKFSAPPSALIMAPVTARPGTPDPIWSGYGNPSPSASQILSDYGEPSLTTNSCPSDSDSALVWAGIGGFDSNSDLAQAGTVVTIGGDEDGEYFYELLPSQPVITLYPDFASSGDTVEVDITYLGADVVSFDVYDVNTAQAMYVTANEGVAFTGETAEAIVERPATASPVIPSDVTDLADFGSVTFSISTSQGSHILLCSLRLRRLQQLR